MKVQETNVDPYKAAYMWMKCTIMNKCKYKYFKSLLQKLRNNMYELICILILNM